MRRWLKRLTYLVGGVVGLLLLAVAGVYGFSAERLGRTFRMPATEDIVIPTDAAAIARGQHLVLAVTKCGECHGPDLGGRLFLNAGPLIGRVYAPNLTRGEGSKTLGFAAADWDRAIRHGLTPDGRALKIMPSEEFVYLTDADLAAILAYIRTLPAVNRPAEPTVVGPIARALYLAGKFPMLPAEHLPDPSDARAPEGVTKEYGRYLANIGGCTGCHGPGLSGGRVPGTPPEIPPAQNLTPEGIGSWTEANFFTAIRTGKRPDGTSINPFMPWPAAANMTDDEIRALWLYLKSVPPRPSGTR